MNFKDNSGGLHCCRLNADRREYVSIRSLIQLLADNQSRRDPLKLEVVSGVEEKQKDKDETSEKTKDDKASGSEDKKGVSSSEDALPANLRKLHEKMQDNAELLKLHFKHYHK